MKERRWAEKPTAAHYADASKNASILQLGLRANSHSHGRMTESPSTVSAAASPVRIKNNNAVSNFPGILSMGVAAGYMRLNTSEQVNILRGGTANIGASTVLCTTMLGITSSGRRVARRT